MQRRTHTLTALIAVALLVFSLFAFATAQKRGERGNTQIANQNTKQAAEVSKKLSGSIEPVDSDKRPASPRNDKKKQEQPAKQQNQEAMKKSSEPDSKTQTVKTVFRGCSEAWIVFPRGHDQFPVTVDVNGETWEIAKNQLEYIPGQFVDRPVYKFNVHDHYGQDAKIRSVTVDGDTRTNDHSCATAPNNDHADRDHDKKQERDSKQSKKPDTPVKKGQDKKQSKKPDTPVKKGKDKQSDKKQKKGDRPDTPSCQQDINDAQDYADGRVCTQQIQDLRCPYNPDVTYTARNGCEISYLKERGWTETGQTGTTTTDDTATDDTGTQEEDSETTTKKETPVKKDTTQEQDDTTDKEQHKTTKDGTKDETDTVTKKPEKSGKTVEENVKHTICHVPPGNPAKVHTITVGSESAVAAHLDHGDYRGQCTEKTTKSADKKQSKKQPEKPSKDVKKGKKAAKKPDTPVKKGKDKQSAKKPDTPAKGETGETAPKKDKKQEQEASDEKAADRKKGYRMPCDKYCGISVDDIVENMKKLKQYVDWKSEKEVQAHEERYNHSRLHDHEKTSDTKHGKHDHAEYMTRDEATNIFATKDHDHAQATKKRGEHSHPEYAEKGHTHPEHQEDTASVETQEHNHSDVKQFALEQDRALAQELKQYVDSRASTKAVKRSMRSEVRGLARQMKQWAESTFARKDRVQHLEQNQRQLRKELDYLKQATGHTDLDTDTAATVMAKGNYSTFTYGDMDCTVYQNGHGPKKVQCVK